jgi:hypothetical protein
MDFDAELVKLLEITDHDEMNEEYAFFCADVDCYFNELDRKAKPLPLWWTLGQGFGKPVSQRHYEEARFIFKDFLRFKGIEGEDFHQHLARFTLAKTRNASKEAYEAHN